tara:strand:+ start:3146 stop:3394 length:249 start_codon:yes stop_codon:yes gene_type:complete
MIDSNVASINKGIIMKDIKESLKLTGWYALGATAIGVSKVINTGRSIALELKKGTPQEFVRYTNQDIAKTFKNKFSKANPET